MTPHTFRSSVACFFLLLLLAGLPRISCAEDWTPKQIVEAFFGPAGIKDKKAIYSGEMIEHYLDKPTMGQTFAPDTKVDEIRLLEQGKDRAIYAVTFSNKGNAFDYYLFLERDKAAWKLDAVRTLWLSGLFFAALEELEKMKTRSPGDEAQYRNMLLTMKCDRDLKLFFSANRNSLQTIADHARNGNRKKADGLAEKLHMNKVFLPEDHPGIIEINIGGMLDNSVGFMYVPKGKKPPAMSSGGYIYIDKIIEHWYLYKTT